MTIRDRDALDECACREAQSMNRMRELDGVRGRGRVKRWELRKGLEQVEDRRKFDALFKR